MKRDNLLTLPLKTAFMFLLLSPILQHNHSIASECMKCEGRADGLQICSPCELTEDSSAEPEKLEASSQGDSVHSPEVIKFIERTRLSHSADFPDPNEPVEALKAYLEETEKLKKAIKNRLFDEPIDTAGLPISKLLEELEKRLLSVRANHPESRHISEGLGSIYRELYEHTKGSEYLLKAGEAFIHAEKMGMKHGVGFKKAHYTEIVSDILTKLGDRNRLEKFFLEVLEAYPKDHLANLHYAKALSKINDPMADDIYKKAMTLEPDGPFDSAISYAEHLLDRGKNQEALDILNKICPPHQRYHFTHFLKGFALEKLGESQEAQKEYNESEKLRSGAFERFTRPPAKYKIPNSKPQEGIKFQDSIDDKKQNKGQKTISR